MSYMEYVDREIIHCNVDKSMLNGYVLFFKDSSGIRYYCGSRGWKDRILIVKRDPELYKQEIKIFNTKFSKYNVSLGKVVEDGIEKISIA